MSQQQYVVGWVCCWEPGYVLSSSFLESSVRKFWFPLKYKLNQTFLMSRFGFTNALMQRHTGLSRQQLTVLKKLSTCWNFFSKSSLGGFYVQLWWIRSDVMSRTGWKDYCWLCHCQSLAGVTLGVILINLVSCKQTRMVIYVHSLALPARRCVCFI